MGQSTVRPADVITTPTLPETVARVDATGDESGVRIHAEDGQGHFIDFRLSHDQARATSKQMWRESTEHGPEQ